MTRAILTCSPHFIDLALNELRRPLADVTVLQHLAPGYILLQTPSSFDQLTRSWQQRLPIYLHHVFPVAITLPLDDDRDLSQLRNAVRRLAPRRTPVQVRSVVEMEALVKVERFLNEPWYTPASDAPTGLVVSVLILPEEAGWRAYLGVSQAAQNLSPWSGGQIPVTECVPNRAGYKLLEALSTFGIRLRRADHALDLGAAPGAWTTLLRRRGLRVTAVAPATLYPWLMFDPGVIYYPMRAEEFLEHCRSTFDFIANDMRLDARDSGRLMVEYAQHLRPDGIAVMTLKLRRSNQARVMDHAFRILRKAYKIIRVRQLVSNGQEVTLFLRRKPTP